MVRHSPRQQTECGDRMGDKQTRWGFCSGDSGSDINIDIQFFY